MRRIWILETHLLGDTIIALRLARALSDEGYDVAFICSEEYSELANVLEVDTTVFPFPFAELRKISSYTNFFFVGSCIKKWLIIKLLVKGGTFLDCRSDFFSWIFSKSLNLKAKSKYRIFNCASKRRSIYPAYWGESLYSRTDSFACDLGVSLRDRNKKAPSVPYSKSKSVRGKILLFAIGSQSIRNLSSVHLKKLFESRVGESIVLVTHRLVNFTDTFDLDDASLLRLLADRVFVTKSFGELVEVISSAKLIVSIDTGPAHLASFLGKRLIFIGGRAEFPFTAPLGSHVVQVAPKRLNCHPCTKNECDNVCFKGCMDIDSVVSVLEKDI